LPIKGLPKLFYWDSDILEMAALLQMDFSLKSFLWLYSGLANGVLARMIRTSADYDMFLNYFLTIK
jgi:hypothetical protein